MLRQGEKYTRMPGTTPLVHDLVMQTPIHTHGNARSTTPHGEIHMPPKPNNVRLSAIFKQKRFNVVKMVLERLFIWLGSV
jgi:hypothetical protein